MEQLQPESIDTLKEQFKAIAAVLAQIDGGTMAEKAKGLGIGRTTLWRWSRKANVRKELEQYLSAKFYVLAQLLETKLLALAYGDLTKAKNLRAAKLVFELAGSYDSGIEERVRRLANAGVTPEIYRRLYSQITKSYPAP